MMSTEEDHVVDLVLCTHNPERIRLKEIVKFTCVSLADSLGQCRTLGSSGCRQPAKACMVKKVEG